MTIGDMVSACADHPWPDGWECSVVQYPDKGGVHGIWARRGPAHADFYWPPLEINLPRWMKKIEKQAAGWFARVDRAGKVDVA
jgi:hypothetical protein